MEVKAYDCINGSEHNIDTRHLPQFIDRILREVSCMMADNEILSRDSLQVSCNAGGVSVHWLPLDGLEAEHVASVSPEYPKPQTIRGLHEFAVSALGALPLRPPYSVDASGRLQA